MTLISEYRCLQDCTAHQCTGIFGLVQQELTANRLFSGGGPTDAGLVRRGRGLGEDGYRSYGVHQNPHEGQTICLRSRVVALTALASGRCFGAAYFLVGCARWRNYCSLDRLFAYHSQRCGRLTVVGQGRRMQLVCECVQIIGVIGRYCILGGSGAKYA